MLLYKAAEPNNSYILTQLSDYNIYGKLCILLTQTWVCIKVWNSAGVIVRKAKTANISSVNKNIDGKD